MLVSSCVELYNHRAGFPILPWLLVDIIWRLTATQKLKVINRWRWLLLAGWWNSSVRTKWRFVHVYQSQYLDSHHGPLLVLIPWELHYGRANDFPNQVRFTKPRVMPAPRHFFNGSFNKICKNHFCLQQQGNKAEVNYVLTNWGASNPPRTIQLKSEVYFIECIYHEMFDVRLLLNLCQTQSIKLLLLWYMLC